MGEKSSLNLIRFTNKYLQALKEKLPNLKVKEYSWDKIDFWRDLELKSQYSGQL